MRATCALAAAAWVIFSPISLVDSNCGLSPFPCIKYPPKPTPTRLGKLKMALAAEYGFYYRMPDEPEVRVCVCACVRFGVLGGVHSLFFLRSVRTDACEEGRERMNGRPLPQTTPTSHHRPTTTRTRTTLPTKQNRRGRRWPPKWTPAGATSSAPSSRCARTLACHATRHRDRWTEAEVDGSVAFCPPFLPPKTIGPIRPVVPPQSKIRSPPPKQFAVLHGADPGDVHREEGELPDVALPRRRPQLRLLAGG